MSETQKIIEALVGFVDGDLTQGELVSQLAALSINAIRSLPNTQASSPHRVGLKEEVLALQLAIERGETITVGSHC